MASDCFHLVFVFDSIACVCDVKVVISPYKRWRAVMEEQSWVPEHETSTYPTQTNKTLTLPGLHMHAHACKQVNKIPGMTILHGTLTLDVCVWEREMR